MGSSPTLVTPFFFFFFFNPSFPNRCHFRELGLNLNPFSPPRSIGLVALMLGEKEMAEAR